jgi:hypothetical protein
MPPIEISEPLKEKLSHVLITRVGDSVGIKFRALAAQEGKTPTDVLRELVESYCDD